MWCCIGAWLNENAAAVQAVGSVAAIFAAIAVAMWQTHTVQRNSADSRDRAARVLAMELLPTIESTHKDVGQALRMNWSTPDHWQIQAIQDREIAAPTVLEGALQRLVVFDEDTQHSILDLLESIRDYRRIQLATSLLTVIDADLAGELGRRNRSLEDAQRHAAVAVKYLGFIAAGKL